MPPSLIRRRESPAMYDPYTFLEDLDNPETLRLAETAHAETAARFLGNDEAETLAADILAQMQDERQIPFCQEHRARMYHFHQSAEYPKGVYRVCSAASYRSGYPEWEILFSVADFDEMLGDDVYLGGVSHYVERPHMALVTLSVAGGDAAYTLEVDLEQGALAENGFHFPAGKNHIAWRDENSVWVCPAWDERQLTASGYPREVWLMRRGQSFEDAQPVFQMDSDGMMVSAWRYLDAQGAAVDLIEASQGFYTKTYLQVSAGGEAMPLDLPDDCDVSGYLAGHLLLTLRKDWQRANQHYPSGSLVAVKLNKGRLGAAQLLFTPSETQALESVETTKRFVVASILDNVSGRLKAWRFSDGQWRETKLPRLPEGALELTDQPWGGDVLYLAASDFTTPLTLYALDLNVMELTVLRRQPEQFDSDGIKVRQLWARSDDGTPIPYYHVCKDIDGADCSDGLIDGGPASVSAEQIRNTDETPASRPRPSEKYSTDTEGISDGLPESVPFSKGRGGEKPSTPSEKDRAGTDGFSDGLSARTPTLIYAYGGFGVPELPHYLGSIGRYWLEKGRAFVLANVRGGGEFGPSWHQAAQGPHKHKSVDDLLAVVRDLHRRRLTAPGHTALQGGSNGGLITAAAFVREPENIGALVCEVPLTDMLRYPLLSAGASWTDEFGNPQKYEICRGYLSALSPYHNLSDGRRYPPALITTSFSDDRVHPAHTLKFYAKLKNISEKTWLYSSDGGGHTGNGTQEQSAEELACILRFLEEAVCANGF